MMLTIGLLTTHLFCRVCNDGPFYKNRLVALETEQVTVATMINSYNERSYIFATRSPPYNGFGVYFGMATGYDEHYGALVPVMAPYYEYGDFKLTSFNEALSLSYSVRF